MASRTNISLYVDQDCNFSVRADTPIPQPAADELLIGTLYSGVNPADVKHATLLGIKPAVLGYDFCGRVLAAPPASKYKEGDIVAGYTPSSLGRPLKYGAHQSCLACPEDMVFRVPLNLPQYHAAALTVVAMTAADALYNLFNFPLPGTTVPENPAVPILIWGASSSVGVCAVQFARRSGYTNILVTASPTRHELLKSLGATRCFDYKSPTVVSDILAATAALGRGPIVYALDAAGSTSDPSSADLMAACVPGSSSKLLSVIFRKDPKFMMPLGLRNSDFVVKLPDAPNPITVPARLKDHWRAWAAVQWAIEHYGSDFELPSVEIFDGPAEEALQEVLNVADGGRGFGKLVIRQPID